MYRERLTITLDKELLQAVDALIDKETLRNRSQTIEHLLKEGIGLHALTQAFLFVEENFNQNQLQKVCTLLAISGITHLFLCLPSSLSSRSAEITALIHEVSSPTVQLVPADFGSGGSLVLQKAALTNPFVLAWVTNEIPLPASLLTPYLFHRSHHGLLTHMLYAADGTAGSFANLSIASPELVAHIPAGIVELKDSVFPGLAKEAKVKGYIYSV